MDGLVILVGVVEPHDSNAPGEPAEREPFVVAIDLVETRAPEQQPMGLQFPTNPVKRLLQLIKRHIDFLHLLLLPIIIRSIFIGTKCWIFTLKIPSSYCRQDCPSARASLCSLFNPNSVGLKIPTALTRQMIAMTKGTLIHSKDKPLTTIQVNGLLSRCVDVHKTPFPGASTINIIAMAMFSRGVRMQASTHF